MTEKEALKIAKKYWPEREITSVGDTLPDKVRAFNLSADECWYFISPRKIHHSSQGFALMSSDLLCLRRSDGSVVWEGDACDEG